jgi:cytidylate kinase
MVTRALDMSPGPCGAGEADGPAPGRDGRIITIDGPAGSGKSTLCRSIAEALGWRPLDTGALYRAVAVAAAELMVSDPVEATLLAESLDIRTLPGPDGGRVWLGDREVTAKLRDPAVGLLSSKLSAIPGVRAALLNVQRQEGSAGRLVCEGRDMGTVVFPWARLKFFLTASPAARARRRQLQLAVEGRPRELAEILASLAIRDESDSGREEAPLRVPPGGVVIDSTDLSLFEVETRMLGEAARVFGPGA